MTIFVVDIEAIDTRYTKQWKERIPNQLKEYFKNQAIVVIEGESDNTVTPGAFLNFASTNKYKSQQAIKIAEMFNEGLVKSGDYFLYTDAWNPTVTQVRYMAQLLGVNVKIGGLWHAGSYDETDFLGYEIGDQDWIRNLERSMTFTYDQNFFATNMHLQMFKRVLFDEQRIKSPSNLYQVGWPMEYLKTSDWKREEKEDIIVFPHRLAREKQLHIFKHLEDKLPKYKFVVTQELNLSKEEYYNLLKKAKVVFSASLHENLGISWYEGVLNGCIPIVPDRRSYAEMSIPDFKYPSEWNLTSRGFIEHQEDLVAFVDNIMKNYDKYTDHLKYQELFMQDRYFSGLNLYYNIEEAIDNG